MKILIVDDVATNRIVMKVKMAAAGYQPLLVADGASCLELVRYDKPDLILLDMSLPVVDGWDAAKALKTNDATKAIPIIALTAHAMAGDKEKAIQAGCDDYDTKPVDLARLLEKIEQWINA